MKFRGLAALGGLVCCVSASAHRLDEYLQATRLGIFAERVEIELDLTPGAAIAAQVFALIGQNGEAYARRVLSETEILQDARRLAPVFIRAEIPTLEQMSAGEGVIRIRARAALADTGSGGHRLRFFNSHQPAPSVYLVNALQPDDPRIQIGKMTRDREQHGLELEYSVSGSGVQMRTWLLVAAAVGIVAWKGTAPLRSRFSNRV